MGSGRQKILITGGAGFIGTHLAERLTRNHKIVIFDNLRRDSLSELPSLRENPNVTFVNGNILDKDHLLDTMRGCDLIIHLAAIAGVSSYYEQPHNTLHVNLGGTMNLLENCKEVEPKKVIHFSTSEVYGSDAFDAAETDNHCIGPVNDFRWTYAVSKLASEQLILRYGETYGFKSYTLRPFNVYGPRQTGEGAISNFLRAVAKNEPMVIYGDGTAIRAWCYVSDCVDAVVYLLDHEDVECGAFNIGNPRATYSTVGLAYLVRHVTGQDVPIVFKEVERTEIKVRVPNIDKARRLLAYEPRVDLADGLRMTYEYFRRHA